MFSIVLFTTTSELDILTNQTVEQRRSQGFYAPQNWEIAFQSDKRIDWDNMKGLQPWIENKRHCCIHHGDKFYYFIGY